MIFDEQNFHNTPQFVSAAGRALFHRTTLAIGPPHHKTAGWLPIIRESGQEFSRAKRRSSADKTVPVLRSKRHLLDTRIPASPTRMFRQFLIFSLALTASHLIQAQATPASTVVPKAKPVEAPEPRITFNFVHVDGPYI